MLLGISLSAGCLIIFKYAIITEGFWRYCYYILCIIKHYFGYVRDGTLFFICLWIFCNVRIF